jgi:hypothetical protein
MKVSEARENVGGLSNPSKMPSKSYGLPAQACKVGGQLRAVKGSTCENCYAYDRGHVWLPSSQEGTSAAPCDNHARGLGAKHGASNQQGQILPLA